MHGMVSHAYSEQQIDGFSALEGTLLSMCPGQNGFESLHITTVTSLVLQ